MSYIPNYLSFLNTTATPDGWPKGVTDEAKEFATECIRLGFTKYKMMDLDLARRCIYEGYVNKAPVPECLRASLMDYVLAVTYRALLAADAKEVFVSRNLPQ